MPISKKLSVTDLDFEEIKTNLKTYLNAQSEFADYDFEGSGLAILIDMLHTILITWVTMLICLPMKCF